MFGGICQDLGPLNRVNVLERIRESGIEILLKTKVLELNENGIRVSRDGKEESILFSDTVVIAMGAKTMAKVARKSERSPTHYIGDCRKVGNALDAIHDAFQLAVRL